MKTLEIDMENCFGISKFEHKFDFADDTCVLIYAPNGMMKSSFARTFECIPLIRKPGKKPRRKCLMNGAF